MEAMRIANAERTRRFNQAEEDSAAHARAYEKGMEEARKRKAEEAERRKRGEEERKRMDEERERNRERKLQAMGKKEGGWDEGKDARMREEDERERRRGFRSANGGIRGTRGGGRLFGEEGRDAFADGAGSSGGDDFRGRGRGRGRGGSRGGRGGRGGFGSGDGVKPGPQNGQKDNQKPPVPDDFPELPTAPKVDTSAKAVNDSDKLPSLSPGFGSGPIGAWADEVAAMDDKK
jgi:hypothetical protein